MKPIPQTAIWSAASFLLCTQLAAAISVYYFDEYAPAWGPDSSFRALSILVIFVSLIVGLLSAVGLGLREHVNVSRPGMTGALLGVCISASVTLYLWINPGFPDNNVIALILGFCALVVGLALVLGLYSGKATS